MKVYVVSNNGTNRARSLVTSVFGCLIIPLSVILSTDHTKNDLPRVLYMETIFIYGTTN